MIVRILFLVLFIICVASAVYGLLLTIDIRKKLSDSISSVILYQQILVYVFAFYGIWGNVFSGFILAVDISNVSLIDKLSTIITMLSLPFLLGSWWFLLQLSFKIRNGLNKKKQTMLMMLINLAVITVVALLLPGNNLLQSITIMFVAGNIFVSTIVSMNFYRSHFFSLKRIQKTALSVFILISGLFISTAAIFYQHNLFTLFIFILFMFVLNVWLPVVFKYCEPVCSPTESLSDSFDHFCQKHGISVREAEIIIQVCSGRTNREIAEKLFITVQTVKDHTSRIYLKTEVRNRTQLANLVRDFNDVQI